MFYYIALFVLLVPFLVLFPTRVKGRRNLPNKGKMILVSNHQTNFDALIIGIRLINRRFWFMAKSELFSNKFKSALFRGLDMYPVNRKHNDIKAVKTTLGLLNKGKAICIFPEGTRLNADEVGEVKNGVALFALKTKSPVVPSIFVKKPRLFRINTLLVGKPFYLHEMEEFKDKPITKDILNAASEIISHKMNELKEDYLAKKESKRQPNKIKKKINATV